MMIFIVKQVRNSIKKYVYTKKLFIIAQIYLCLSKENLISITISTYAILSNIVASYKVYHKPIHALKVLKI